MLLLTKNGIVVHQVVQPNEGQQIDHKKTFCHLEKFSLNAQKMTTVSLQQQLVDARWNFSFHSRWLSSIDWKLFGNEWPNRQNVMYHPSNCYRPDNLLLISISTCRGAVAQPVERPSKVPVWSNSFVGSNHERDMSSRHFHRDISIHRDRDLNHATA